MNFLKKLFFISYSAVIMAIIYGFIWLGQHGVAPMTSPHIGMAFSTIGVFLVVAYEYFPVILEILEGADQEDE